MVFPDGTHALRETIVRRAPRRVRHRRRPVGLRQEHAAAHRLRARPRPPAASSIVDRSEPRATCSRTPRCCSGAPCSATSSCSPSSKASARPNGAAARRRASQLVGLDGLREEVPEAAVGRHEDARVAGPLAGARSRRCSCSTSRSARSTRSPASGSTTSCISLFQRKGFAGAVHHPLDHEAVFLSTRVLVMSARPGPHRRRLHVPFAYPRSPELRFEPAFAELCGQVSHAAARSARMSIDDAAARPHSPTSPTSVAAPTISATPPPSASADALGD